MQVREWKKKVFYCAFTLAIWLFAFPGGCQSEQLPIKTYSTADGLARDQINRIVKDSRGFLWFCTPEGISRFDGYKFTNYTTQQGLPDRHVNDLLETRDGAYWLATGDGLCRFNPAGAPQQNVVSNDTSFIAPLPMFATYRPNDNKSARFVNVLLEDHSGAIWCGTYNGLYRVEEAKGLMKFDFVDIGLSAEKQVAALLEDRQGTLWIGTESGLYRRAVDGSVHHYTTKQGLPDNFVQALLEDSEGRLWGGTRFGGMFQITSTSDANRPFAFRTYMVKDGLGNNWVTCLFESSDKKLWIGTNVGLTEMLPEADKRGRRFQNYTTAQGLSDREVWALAEDRDGSLWMGTLNGGAMKLARKGFITYGVADGLNGSYIYSIFENHAGELCLFSRNEVGRALDQFDGKRFVAIQPRLSEPIAHPNWGWGWNQVALQDHKGEWWLATGQGVYRYPQADSIEQLSHLHPKAVYTRREGLGGTEAFRLYEDSRGDIWVSTLDGESHLTRWERATATFHCYSGADGVRPDAPTAFCEDASGSLWVGFYHGGLAWYRAGQFRLYTEEDGIPAGMIRSLYLDKGGRLWIASSQGGISCLEDVTADRLRFKNYTIHEGLSSDDVWCITEDQWGRIYAGTGRGLDRLDPQSGTIIHYTSTDGLARGKVEEAFRDRQGSLWFGTSQGLSRLVARLDQSGSPPPIVISGLRIAGVPRQISELGETQLSGLVLEPSQNDVEIDFVGLGFSADKALHYQFKLAGSDADWHPLTEQRSVNYENLAPGTYFFSVQAVSADGMVSPVPATVSFKILRPLWQRWWFLSLISIAIVLLIYGMHRYRVARLLDLERVRVRIATDLHDDIGSSLSRVAILSEVVKQQMGNTTSASIPILSEMAESSRGLVDSMSDIVWSIDPRRDDLSNLAQRIRQFAADVLEARKIHWDLQIPQEFDKIRLNPEQRRQLFLIFKEAINNIARHAECNTVWLKIIIDHHYLTAEILDNGCGFDSTASKQMKTNGYGGHGLKNIQQRAAQIGGQGDIYSSLGKGTCIKLRIPLKK